MDIRSDLLKEKILWYRGVRYHAKLMERISFEHDMFYYDRIHIKCDEVVNGECWRDILSTVFGFQLNQSVVDELIRMPIRKIGFKKCTILVKKYPDNGCTRIKIPRCLYLNILSEEGEKMEKKNHTVPVRLSDTEYRKLMAMSAYHGWSKSAVLRSLLCQKFREKPQYSDFLD